MNDTIINCIYEQLNEGIKEGTLDHGMVLMMFKDFLEDTIMIEEELGLTKQDANKMRKAKDALEVAAQVQVPAC